MAQPVPAIAARRARTLAGTLGVILGAWLLVADAVLAYQPAVAPSQLHTWMRWGVVAAWALMLASYVLARLVPVRSGSVALAARDAQRREYRSTALPAAACMLLVPASIYYLVGEVAPDILVPHPATPGRVTRGDVLLLVSCRHLLVPFLVPCFGLARALREGRVPPTRLDAFRMHPLNISLLSIYGIWMAVAPTFGGPALRIAWLASIAILVLMWLALVPYANTILGERAALAAVAGEYHEPSPRWLPWLKAATLFAPYLALSLCIAECGSRTVEIGCERPDPRGVACTLHESTFATSTTYRFSLAPTDVVTAESHRMTKGGLEYRLVRKNPGGDVPLGTGAFVSDGTRVRAAAEALDAAARGTPLGSPLHAGSRWTSVLAALIVLAGALAAAGALVRKRHEDHSPSAHLR